MSRVVWVLLLSTGCGPPRYLVRTVDYVREIDQDAIVPAPSGPHAVGPLATFGAFTIEASGTMAADVPVYATREQGAPGERLAGTWGRGRIALGLAPHLELGFQLGGAPAAWTQALATDLGPSRFEGVLGRGGLGMRWHWRFDSGLGLGAILELDGGFIPYLHDETLTITATDYDEYGPVSTVTRVDRNTFQRATWFWTGRTGPALSWTSAEGATIGFATTVENLPFVYGYDRATWGCAFYSDGTGGCEQEPRRPVDVVQMGSWSATASLAVPLGDRPWLLFGSVDAHLSDNAMSSGLPASGQVGLRFAPETAASAMLRGR